RKSLAPVVYHRHQRDAVDLGRVALKAAGGNCDLVLAREVRVFAVPVEKAGRLTDQSGHIEEFIMVDSRDRTARGIADHIATSAHRRKPGGLEPREDLGGLFESNVVKLNVLTSGQFALVAPVSFGNLADGAQPGGSEDPAGDLDAHHEGADLGLVVI